VLACVPSLGFKGPLPTLCKARNGEEFWLAARAHAMVLVVFSLSWGSQGGLKRGGEGCRSSLERVAFGIVCACGAVDSAERQHPAWLGLLHHCSGLLLSRSGWAGTGGWPHELHGMVCVFMCEYVCMRIVVPPKNFTLTLALLVCGYTNIRHVLCPVIPLSPALYSLTHTVPGDSRSENAHGTVAL
jgi:hypothetical protein